MGIAKEKSGYYCNKCGRWHRTYSKVGKEHTLYDIPANTRMMKEDFRLRFRRMEAVKGLQGFYHVTEGVWDETGNKLKTLCGTSISPNYRRFSNIKRVVNCPKCREVLGGKG